MVHRSGRSQQMTMSMVQAPPPPPPSQYYHTSSGHVPGAGATLSSDQGLSVSMCQCNTFLDPYPSGQSVQWRSMGGMQPLSVSALQHYCRVCNTQLNSCKQARIHVSGKKHEKRLAYLKFSLETSEAVNNSCYTSTAAPAAGQYAATAVPPQPQQVQMTSAMPTVYTAYPPPPPPAACTAYSQPPAPAYYYPAPAASYTSQPPHGIYHYDQQPPPAPQPPTSAASASLNHYSVTHNNNCNSRRGKTTGSGPTAVSHGVMSPSLTSGFSGSGDCKSTETCSLLSVASYNSATPASGGQGSKERGQPETGERGVTSSGVRHMVHCEVCHLPFPSRAVLEHHLMGSRHARKVKAVSVLRQLQENGAEFRATEATGDIRCEVCEVSVNSSHQLQAHMTGHKHKLRCARQGVAPNKTILTPASSTAPSTTPSEASAPVRSYSILVGRPQFGSRPNLYKTTPTARGSGRSGGGHDTSDLRHRSRHTTVLNKLTKSRKIVRPRLKTDISFRQSRIAKSISADMGRCGGGSAAADSTTESDEPGTTKQKPQLLAKKQETSLDKNETVDGDAEESDEAKESEEDQDSSNGAEVDTATSSSGTSESSGGDGESRAVPRYADIAAAGVTRSNSVNISQITKASQTDPLRRLSVDDCDLLSKKPEPEENNNKESTPVNNNSKEIASKEPRRRSVSASYTSQSNNNSAQSNNSNSKSSNNSNKSNSSNSSNYQCNLCQISVNSQSQLAQHMNSNKHRRLSIALQSHMSGGRGKMWYQGEFSKESLAQSQNNRECNVREIPMLSMFLQRLHQHHYFPPIRDDEDAGAETHR